MRNLITYEDISRLARPCSADRETAEAMIAEAQRVEIKPRLGDALYLALVEDSDTYGGGSATEVPKAKIGASDGTMTWIIGGLGADIPMSRFDKLLEGGDWIDSRGCRRIFSGVKSALAYYALARIVRDGNIQVTTYGVAVKNDQYSTDPEVTERRRQYREIFAQADSYMAEVLNYLNHNRRLFPEYAACGAMRSNRMTIKIIGR